MLIHLIYDILTYRVIIMPYDVIEVTDVGYGLLLVFCQAINQTNYYVFVNSIFRNKLWWQNTHVFFLENMFEIDVCKMAAILFRPQVARGEIKLLQINPNFYASQNLFRKLLPSHLTYDCDILHCIDSIVLRNIKFHLTMYVMDQQEFANLELSGDPIFLRQLFRNWGQNYCMFNKICTYLYCDLFYWYYIMVSKHFMVNSLRPSDVYMRQ